MGTNISIRNYNVKQVIWLLSLYSPRSRCIVSDCLLQSPLQPDNPEDASLTMFQQGVKRLAKRLHVRSLAGQVSPELNMDL